MCFLFVNFFYKLTDKKETIDVFTIWIQLEAKMTTPHKSNDQQSFVGFSNMCLVKKLGIMVLYPCNVGYFRFSFL